MKASSLNLLKVTRGLPYANWNYLYLSLSGIGSATYDHYASQFQVVKRYVKPLICFKTCLIVILAQSKSNGSGILIVVRTLTD